MIKKSLAIAICTAFGFTAFSSWGLAKTFKGSGGVTSEYEMYLPKDYKKVLVFVHGDGGARNYDDFLPELKKALTPYGFGALVVQAPDGHAVWHKRGDQNAFWLDELLTKFVVKPSKNADLQIYFAGVSGGAVFIGGQFVPLMGQNYKGGAILLCGGAPPLILAGDLTIFTVTDSMKKNFKTWVKINKDDYIRKQAEEGIAAYKAMGLSIQQVTLPKGGHCGFPILPSIIEGLKALKAI